MMSDQSASRGVERGRRAEPALATRGRAVELLDAGDEGSLERCSRGRRPRSPDAPVDVLDQIGGFGRVVR